MFLRSFIVFIILTIYNTNAETINCNVTSNYPCQCLQNNTCTINCDEIFSETCVSNQTLTGSLTCKGGYPCAVNCIGTASCYQLYLDGSQSTHLTVNCSAQMSCYMSTILCGTGDCAITCNGLDACSLISIYTNDTRSFHCNGVDCPIDIMEFSYNPTSYDTFPPTTEPTSEPTIEPSLPPTNATELSIWTQQSPILKPTKPPTQPTIFLNVDPTIEPTTNPTNEPTLEPTIGTSEDDGSRSVMDALNRFDIVSGIIGMGIGCICCCICICCTLPLFIHKTQAKVAAMQQKLSRQNQAIIGDQDNAPDNIPNNLFENVIVEDILREVMQNNIIMADEDDNDDVVVQSPLTNNDDGFVSSSKGTKEDKDNWYLGYVNERNIGQGKEIAAGWE